MPFPLRDLYSLVPELILLAGAMVILLADLFARSRRTAAGMTVVVLILTALTVSGPMDGSFFGGLYVFDAYAIFFKILFLITALLATLLSIRFLEALGELRGEFYVLLLCATAGMMVMASAADLMVAYLGLELMALSVYVLTGFLRRDARSNEAAMKYFLNGAFASAFLLYGIALTYGMTGTTNLSAVAAAISENDLAATPALLAGIGMIVAAFGFKIALVPFHFWAPDAYEGAPTPVTAFMSVGPKAAAFALSARVLFTAYGPSDGAWTGMLAALAAATMIVGNLVALRQTNIKRMLAYSSVAHAGYMLLGLVAGTEAAVGGTMVYVMVYAFMNIGAFAVVILLSGETAAEEIDNYQGLAKTHPGAALLMLIFMFSLTGIPPTAGFIGKFHLFQEVLRAGHTGLVVLAVLMSSVSAFYYLRIVMYMYMREPGEEPYVLGQSAALGLAVAVTVVVVVFVGLFPETLLAFARESLPSF